MNISAELFRMGKRRHPSVAYLTTFSDVVLEMLESVGLQFPADLRLEVLRGRRILARATPCEVRLFWRLCYEENVGSPLALTAAAFDSIRLVTLARANHRRPVIV